MALQSRTITVGADRDSNNGGKNYVSGQVIYIKDEAGVLAPIFRDIDGLDPIAQNTISNVTNAKGQFTFFIEEGNYIAEYNDQSTPLFVFGADYFNNQIEFVTNQIISNTQPYSAGSFADGFTFTELNQYGNATVNDGGTDYATTFWYIGGTLPHTVAPLTNPRDFPLLYQQRDFNSAEFVATKTTENAQDFIDSFALKVFQSPTNGLTEINTRTLLGGEAYEVRKVSDGTLATIYSNKTGLTEIAQDGISNVSDSDGVVKFFVADGDYYAEVGAVRGSFYAGNISSSIRATTVPDAQTIEFKIGQLVRLTDRGDGLFKVFPAGTSSDGFKSIGLASGLVLVLQHGSRVDSRWFGTSKSANDNQALQVAINNTNIRHIDVRDYDVSSGGCYVDRNDLVIDFNNETLDFTGVGHAALVLGENSAGALSSESRVNIEVHNVVTTGDRTAGSYVCFFRLASTCKLKNWRAWFLASAFGGDGTDLTHLSLCCEFTDLDIRYCTVGVNDVAGSFQGSEFIGGRIEANEVYGIETASTNLQLIGTVVEGNGRNGGAWDGAGYEIKVGGGGTFTMIGGYMERFSTLINKAMINVDPGSTKRINLIGVDIYGQDAANAHIVNGDNWTTGSLHLSGGNINGCSHICTRGGAAGNWKGYFEYFSDAPLNSPENTLNGGAYTEISRAEIKSTGNIRVGGSVTARNTRVTDTSSDSQNTTFQRYIGDIATGGAGDWHDVISLSDIQAGASVGNMLDITFACRQADFRFKVLLDLENATLTGTPDFYAGNWSSSNFRISGGFLQVDNLPASGRDWNAAIVATRTAFS